MVRARMEEPARLGPDRRHHLGMAVPQQQRAVAHDVADELVAVEVPFARALGPRHRERERIGQPDVVRHAAGKQMPGPGAERRRPRVLRGPPGDGAAFRCQPLPKRLRPPRAPSRFSPPPPTHQQIHFPPAYGRRTATPRPRPANARSRRRHGRAGPGRQKRRVRVPAPSPCCGPGVGRRGGAVPGALSADECDAGPAGRWAAASKPCRPADGAVARYGTIGRRQRREVPRGLPAPYGPSYRTRAAEDSQ